MLTRARGLRINNYTVDKFPQSRGMELIEVIDNIDDVWAKVNVKSFKIEKARDWMTFADVGINYLPQDQDPPQFRRIAGIVDAIFSRATRDVIVKLNKRVFARTCMVYIRRKNNQGKKLPGAALQPQQMQSLIHGSLLTQRRRQVMQRR
jgi:hypothetical protein